MKVEHSGWNNERGYFRDEIYVDENKTDYEIRFKGGGCAKQTGAFEEVTRDWNNDGDVYPIFGAYFEHFDKDGKSEGVDFWSPEQMVSQLIEGLDPENRNADQYKVVDIPGIELPAKEKKASLDERILRNERRDMTREVERNQKMNRLGIRPSNEPWAR